LILTVLRTVFGVVGLRPDTALGWGRAVIGDGLGGGGRCEVEGALNLLGVVGVDLTDGMFPVLFLVLLMGRAGKAIFGGALDGPEGPEGRGRAVVMAVDASQSQLLLKNSTRPQDLEDRLPKHLSIPST